MKLNEGEIHSFQVLKRIDIPNEGEFFTLRHQSGRRLLLSAQTYNHYSITPGNTIFCKIDKVNCSGKVYLEPMHPIYEEGKDYEFEIILRESNNDGEEVGLFVIDCFGNQIYVPISNSTITLYQKTITLTISRIKKGIPILSHPSFIKKNKELSSICGKKLQFNVLGIGKNIDNEEVFLLINDAGYRSELKVKHYKSYGIEIGNTLECEVYSYNHLGVLKVEPKNPFYEVGKEYNFIVVCNEIEDNSIDDENVILIVEDRSANNCGVLLKSNIYNELKQKPSIKCRVVGFRRGRPKLEFVQNAQ
jgi:hypothetical protein